MNKYHVIVVGCGGTGSALLPMLTRYLASKYTGNDGQNIRISVIDGDTVEKKNLQRQCFQEEDIGVNKALVFADALTDVFNVFVGGYSHYIDTVKQLDEIVGNFGTPIIISCVDNRAARLVMNDYFDSKDSAFFIDAGNGYTDGQCVYAAREDGVTVSPSWLYYYGDKPAEGEVVKSRTAMSCSELNDVAPQHIAVNQMSAMNIFMGVVSIIEERPMRGIQVFDILKGTCYHEEPEKYGFSVKKQLDQFFKGMKVEEKLSYIKEGKFLAYLAGDKSVTVKKAALDKIAAKKKISEGRDV